MALYGANAKCDGQLPKHFFILKTFLNERHLIILVTLTHWGRATHICVSDLTSIGSDNGLSPGRRQAIIRTNAGILLIRPLGTNISEFSFEILMFSFKKMRLKVSSAKRRPFCLGLNELTHCWRPCCVWLARRAWCPKPGGPWRTHFSHVIMISILIKCV